MYYNNIYVYTNKLQIFRKLNCNIIKKTKRNQQNFIKISALLKNNFEEGGRIPSILVATREEIAAGRKMVK